MTLVGETLAANQRPTTCFFFCFFFLTAMSTLQFNEWDRGKEHGGGLVGEMMEMEPICTSMLASAAVTRTQTDIDEEVEGNRREQEAAAISMFN